MHYKFSSAITRGGSVIRPDVIVIDGNNVTYKKRNSYLINSDTVSIPISKVSSVKIDTSIIGTTISIEGTGRSKITVEKFSKSDAKEIKALIQRLQQPKPEAPKNFESNKNKVLENKIRSLENRIDELVEPQQDTDSMNLPSQSFGRKSAVIATFPPSRVIDIPQPGEFQYNQDINRIKLRMTLREMKLKELEALKSNPSTKWLYWLKLIWEIYLDSTWKKVLFFFILIFIIAQISELFTNL